MCECGAKVSFFFVFTIFSSVSSLHTNRNDDAAKGTGVLMYCEWKNHTQNFNRNNRVYCSLFSAIIMRFFSGTTVKQAKCKTPIDRLAIAWPLSFIQSSVLVLHSFNSRMVVWQAAGLARSKCASTLISAVNMQWLKFGFRKASFYVSYIVKDIVLPR